MGKIFYIGNAKEEVVKEFIKEDDYVVGACPKDWFVLIDRTAIKSYMHLLYEKAILHLKEKVQSKKPLSSIKVDDEKLLRKLIYDINEHVMHELVIHQVGKLYHYQLIDSLRFVNKAIDYETVISLAKKCGLERSKIIPYMNKKERVTGIFFREREKASRKIKKLCKELISTGLELKIMTVKKEYPLKFELDDIKIT